MAICTADEFAITMALERLMDDLDELADVILFAGIDDVIPKIAESLDIERVHDLLLEDADIESLCDPKLDGVEADEFLRREISLANLHPNDWFTTFAGRTSPS